MLPASRTVAPPPDCEPPDQASVPATLSIPAPLTVPPRYTIVSPVSDPATPAVGARE